MGGHQRGAQSYPQGPVAPGVEPAEVMCSFVWTPALLLPCGWGSRPPLVLTGCWTPP